MAAAFFVFILFVFGLIGAVLGDLVKKTGVGFFLGVFLGPIGWIIVSLLPRVVETKEVSTTQKKEPVSIAQTTKPEVRVASSERNLKSDDYKFWLSKTYNIQKNGTF